MFFYIALCFHVWVKKVQLRKVLRTMKSFLPTLQPFCTNEMSDFEPAIAYVARSQQCLSECQTTQLQLSLYDDAG